MKKTFHTLCLCFALLLFTQTNWAQGPAFTNGVSAKYVLIDHLSPLQGRDVDWFTDLTQGVEVAYYRGLDKNFNLAFPLRFGRVTLPDDRNNLGFDSPFLSIDGTIQFQPIVANSLFSPYGLVGIGGFVAENKWSAEVPFGAGINIRIGRNSYIQLQSEYRTDFSDLRTNFMHSAGLFWCFGNEVEELPIELPPADRDGDGISDAMDKCPDTPGLAAFSGCPDTDNDGIADANDACPEVAGTLAFNGCPDTDGDGLPDNQDACPNQMGPKENKGCPLADADGDGIVDADDECPNAPGTAINRGCPDRDGDGVVDKNDACPDVAGTLNGCPDGDGDGVADKDDRCPETAGPASNKGCPVIKEEVQETLNFVAKNVQFETGKATLKSTSNAILDKVVEIMKQYPNYSLAIGGHTDSIGDAATNQLLSERRAKSCYDYLVSKGVAASRMNYVGYGETRPIGDNRYKDGRELNRRVEFNLFLN